eukprot:3836368-Prymnesium_polylepis.1
MAILRAALKERPPGFELLHVEPIVNGVRIPVRTVWSALPAAAEEKAFKCALKVMGDLYASAVATNVLQLKEIEPRPAEYDGMLCLGELTESANENAVRVCFSPFGTIVNFEPGTNPARLTFLEHESAVHAAAADTPNSICSFVCVTWNDRAYTNRGWVGCAHSNSQLLK